MNKILALMIFLTIFSAAKGQEITTLRKLHDISVELGVANNIAVDTMQIKTHQIRISNRLTEQQSNLLRASEAYSKKNYESAKFYIAKVAGNFKNNDLNNLKFVILVGSYAHLKNAGETAKYFYIADKSSQLAPESMNIIRNEIGKCFKKKVFFDALSYYYYYHARLKIINEIKFEE